jgi:hypothetical protein
LSRGHLDTLPGKKLQYAGWQELFEQVEGAAVIASRHCHAVLAKQSGVHHFFGRWRDAGIDPRLGQERGQLG